MGEMKRLWAAVGILAALLAAALGTGWWVDGLTADYVSRLEQAQAMSERGDWERAAQVTGGVYRNWQERSFWLHALLRHSDTDQVLLLFRSVEEYLKLEEMDQYAAANAQLIAQLELLAEMEDPSLENVLKERTGPDMASMSGPVLLPTKEIQLILPEGEQVIDISTGISE